MNNQKKTKVLLCATGSVASIKVVELAQLLSKDVQVRIAVTENAKHFIKDKIPKEIEVYTDVDEWKWKERNDPVLHIEVSIKQNTLMYNCSLENGQMYY